LNGELFVVFRTLDGTVQLQADEKVHSAKLADDWFRPTDTDVQSSLRIRNDKLQLKSTAVDILGKGIRLTIRQD
jgi:hypothetical protein